ncbi:MAG TPA: AI-2E family transporter [Burkholderiales bacterium]|nr:AI-2E family transporter [Burkholderiales bacterium]
MREPYSPYECPDAVDIAAWLLMAAALVLILRLHLLTALLSGLLVFELVHMIAPVLQRRFFGRRHRMVAVALLATLIVGLVSAAVIGILAFLRSDAGSLEGLLHKMAEILASARGMLPHWIVDYLPDDVDDMRNGLSNWLHDHAGELRLAGAETARSLVHIIIGMIIGAMLALHEAVDGIAEKPLATSLSVRAARLGDAFKRVVFAQVRISLINTSFTAIYLALVLPLFGVTLPFTKTMIAITFVAGLLPVIGNLISNTVIVVISLAYSVYVAGASLVFLIVIHKLEYFLNARIIGSRIQARAWELLIAMLAMESAFGLNGVVAAPIYYAYIKAELADRGLV